MEKPSLKKPSTSNSKIITDIKEIIEREPQKNKKDYLSTGCTLLDLVVGGGLGMGFPAGKIVNIVGDKSSGKSFLSAEIVAANYYKYKGHFKHNYDDGESGFTFDTNSLYGFEMIDENTLQSKKIEEFDVNVQIFLKDKLKKDELGIYVLDSLDGLSDNEKEKRALERYKKGKKGEEIKNDGTYGTLLPKFLSQEFFREQTGKFEERKANLFIVSQVRENINPGQFGAKYTRNGGKALDFYAFTCLWLAQAFKIEKNNKAIGIMIEAFAKKSKTPRPYRRCKIILYFDYGIDDIGSNLNYLYDCWGKDGKLKKSSNTIIWDNKKEESRESLIKFLEGKEIRDTCQKDKLEETGVKHLSLEYMKDWIAKSEYKKDYEKTFGRTLGYHELVEMISMDSEMEKELEKRVIDKWEAEENEVSTDRKRKYS